MKRINLIAFLLTLILFYSCDKDDIAVIDDSTYLIFGHFYGNCEGEECVETFKLTGSSLFEDATDSYLVLKDYDFNKLSNARYEMVKDLWDYFPIQLLNKTGHYIGCPDCYDQGGLLIQYAEKGKIQSWRIDLDKSMLPSYLHNFIDKVNEKIEMINEMQ